MSEVIKNCCNCAHEEYCNDIGCTMCGLWKESELSKCKRKLGITVAWLEVISKTSTNIVDRSSAYHVISKLKEIDNAPNS